ncbi:hypothetical protein GCM10017788_60080 [Amycolatopsis acidiphila]|nr:hypothetical protein GCM10017788_60080 [Amycolatopsis acidiphila]
MHDPDLPATPPRPRKPIWKRWWFWLPVGFVVLIVVAGIVGPASPATNQVAVSDPAGAQSPQPARSPGTSELPTSSVSSAHTSAPPPVVPAAALRGLWEQPNWWDQNRKATSTSLCTEEGETPVGTERAWSLASGAVACVDDTPVTAGVGP